MKRILPLLLIFLLAGCAADNTRYLGSAPRKPLTDEEREAYYREVGAERTLYYQDGVAISANGYLEIDSWKLQELADAYGLQSDNDYLNAVEEILDAPEDYWMAHSVETDDFTADVFMYNDGGIFTLEIRLLEEVPFIIAVRGCIVNGVLRADGIFKGSEPEAGRFLITADEFAFSSLEMFGVYVDNVSSIAWLLTAINTETRDMTHFMLATQFVAAGEWGGLHIGEHFSADAGIIMWTLDFQGSTYLCVFNGNTNEIETEVMVTAEQGSLISDSFALSVMSGECSFVRLGYELNGVEVFLDDMLLYSDSVAADG